MTNDLVKATGVFAQQPSELKTIIAGSEITVSNDSNNFTISSDVISTDHHTMNQIDSYLADYTTSTALNAFLFIINLRNNLM